MIITEEQRKEAHEFYREALELLDESGAKYMLGGAFAMFHYTGVYRDTKDLDIFCKSTEYPKILKYFCEKGYRIELTDVRWLAKVFKGEYFIDIIFDTVNNICRVDETWYERSIAWEFAGRQVRMIPAEELIWCKLYVQNRERFDGADINHIMLKYGQKLDWKHVLFRMEQHWHLLLAQI
ncbi:MAG TPA: nucleotidyltransferase, partial [Segetibacter sp.]|nr:nucleotidyltransferase [Segetibacter sp.]